MYSREPIATASATPSLSLTKRTMVMRHLWVGVWETWDSVVRSPEYCIWNTIIYTSHPYYIYGRGPRVRTWRGSAAKMYDALLGNSRDIADASAKRVPKRPLTGRWNSATAAEQPFMMAAPSSNSNSSRHRDKIKQNKTK